MYIYVYSVATDAHFRQKCETVDTFRLSVANNWLKQGLSWYSVGVAPRFLTFCWVCSNQQMRVSDKCETVDTFRLSVDFRGCVWTSIAQQALGTSFVGCKELTLGTSAFLEHSFSQFNSVVRFYHSSVSCATADRYTSACLLAMLAMLVRFLYPATLDNTEYCRESRNCVCMSSYVSHVALKNPRVTNLML